MLPGVFLDKLPLNIDFIGEAVVQYVSVVKILLWMLVIYKFSQINSDVNTYVLFVDPVLCTVLIP